ncbi:MAG TPA: YbaK/EbsC family protein [Burkholderiales bacterium]|jgi:Ala-tRNA(Pro) deacylase|nr:YbaK/EbsC family protein [Burkholderiales bacterium]
MVIAKTVERYLDEHHTRYTVVRHPTSLSSKQTAAASQVPPGRIAKAVVVGDDRGFLMAVIPGDRHVQLHRLSDKFRRDFSLVTEQRIAPIFKDCELGAIPPLGLAYGMPTIVDDSLVGRDHVFFVGGDHDELIRVDGDAFVRMLGEAQHGQFSH